MEQEASGLCILMLSFNVSIFVFRVGFTETCVWWCVNPLPWLQTKLIRLVILLRKNRQCS